MRFGISVTSRMDPKDLRTLRRPLNVVAIPAPSLECLGGTCTKTRLSAVGYQDICLVNLVVRGRSGRPPLVPQRFRNSALPRQCARLKVASVAIVNTATGIRQRPKALPE